MINPNAKHSIKGTITKLERSADREDISLEVTLDNGTTLSELGFLYHRTAKLGDRVNCIVGFTIMSDRYGIESIRRILKI